MIVQLVYLYFFSHKSDISAWLLRCLRLLHPLHPNQQAWKSWVCAQNHLSWPTFNNCYLLRCYILLPSSCCRSIYSRLLMFCWCFCQRNLRLDPWGIFICLWTACGQRRKAAATPRDGGPTIRWWKKHRIEIGKNPGNSINNKEILRSEEFLALCHFVILRFASARTQKTTLVEHWRKDIFSIDWYIRLSDIMRCSDMLSIGRSARTNAQLAMGWDRQEWEHAQG